MRTKIETFIVLRKEKEEMKNTFLKKAGAVALAAVMAVTFAPVASLDVFAATKVIDATGATSGSGDTYVLSGTAMTFTVTAPGVTVVDVNGVSGATIEVKDKDAKVTIKNSKKLKNNGTDIPTVNVTITTATSVTLCGNFREGTLTDNASLGFSYGDPRAKVGDNTYVGQGAISKGFLLDEDVSVGALHGSVSISNLGAGRWAYVSDTADKGTTITASTDDDTTLQKYVTTYTFGYYAPKDLNPGNMGSYRGSVGTYTDTRYYGGLEAPAANDGCVALTSDANLDGESADENNLLAANKIFSNKGIAWKTVKGATNASTITIGTSGSVVAAYPLTGYTGVTYTFKKDYKAAVKAKTFHLANNLNGQYYTWDVKDMTDEGEALAIVDGDKYVKRESDNQLGTANSHIYPTKSYKLVQSSAYSKEDGNKGANVAIAYYNEGVTLEAADDVTIARDTITNVTGNNTTVKLNAGFFGKNKSAASGDDSHPELGTTPIKGSVAGVKLEVLKLAKDVDTVEFDGVDSKATVERASGIGYYRTEGYNYTFGKTDVITKAFKKAAEGTVNSGLLANPDFRDGTVFASKEIKTTVEGVNADVTFLGEISAEATKTDANGKKTWEINLADTATNDKAVVAYRLYDGNRGEHIYTYNATERDMLVKAGWKEEPSDIKVLHVDAKTGVTVYRVYNPNNGGAHVYTTNPEEVKMLLAAGWEEGVAVFKTPAAGTANTLPVYRVYNTGSKNGEHQFTTSAAEKDNLVNHGWKLEGTPWYSFK